ncbi:DUF5052 family protein [Paenibacillus sp. GCM10027626]|uniref:DUF5052 family protein n=1 Tax=Paenibacillus sp. GCM10027626 TaxID=3273411 RepID=UPI0036285AE7
MKRIMLIAAAAAVIFVLSGCESWDRAVKDIGSNINGLDRKAEVYDQNGNVIKTYSGKFDVEVNEYGNKVKFDINGKRVLIYNATVVIEEQEKE